MTGDAPANRRRLPQRQSALSADDAVLGVVVGAARVARATTRLLSRAPGVSPLVERSAATGRAARVRGRERMESAAQTALSAPEVQRLVDGALAGPLPEAVARSSVEHHVGDRLAAELESERARWLQQVLDSREFEEALERALSSPKVREALARQTATLAEEITGDVRARTTALDRRLAFGQARGERAFPGLASRALAFATDLVLAQLLFLVGATILGLVVALVGDLRPTWLFGLLASVGWLLVVGAYFVFFWTLGGQTPGMRLLRLRVVDRHGRTLKPLRATVRFGALLVAIIPFFAGFLPILFDRLRRGVHDLLAGTVVVYVD